MLNSKDTTSLSNQICQIGFTDNDRNVYTSLFDTYKAIFISKFFSASKARDTVIPITCEDIKLMSSAVVSLSVARITTDISSEDFKKCDSFLGNILSWSAEQLSALAILALKVLFLYFN